MQAALLSAVILLLFLGGLIWIVPVQNYSTEQHFAPRQPVMFSHEHHAGGLGLDCRYCHNSIEISANAGMPTTETCMTCHSQIWTHAEMLAPVRASFATHKPLRWTTTVYEIPDYVFFNHSIHVAKGIGCEECHGRVDKMPLMRQAHTFHMLFCVDCHNNPAPHLRPRDQVFNMDWRRTADTPSPEALMIAYKIRPPAVLTDCGICHR